ncbi:anthranilate synthase component II [Reinekea blandensis]|uniref:Probable anthranilate synthase, component II n=1 Tax=Reinekea blandensis MED297 TaxID=314283 RepID=A4BEX3_9GAMM|nr:aminodeoxychorismate/anthranilate synthase component II [Reinekea blandensis]EAR09308.1 probable anthranilate synthase, component II [Reinekea sp. MED297] [Reinekea blandensis MED297]
MNILIIDNYDSFTFNLYQFIGEILEREQRQGTLERFDIVVKRNDEVSLADVQTMAPDRIIISPGPGSPDDKAYFGVCAEVITEMGPTTPLLGVCLGMQGIVHCFGGDIVKAPLPMHGKISPVNHDNSGVFRDLPDQLEVMRYHSLIANAQTLPECLRVNATVGDLGRDDFEDRAKLSAAGDFEIMGVVHRKFPITGIQFHPESFATEGGQDLIRQFLFQA